MANQVTISEIEDRLQRLPPEKLGVVYDLISYLLDREGAALLGTIASDTLQTMPAPEQVLRRERDRLEDDVWDWDRLEEGAWAGL
ncbi:hypothetical protein SBDP1_330014 [Syntrophobacter sp. SbD1]|nr:hypothetical protein SBDP1_330014 [Syntrophobacter sp. SbD1]